MMILRHNNFLAVLCLLLVAGCAPAPVISTQAEAASALAASPQPSLAPSATQQLTPTQTPEVTATALPTRTPEPAVCSPLGDIPLTDLPGMVSNPFHPPPPGSDDPHHGVDLAVLLPGSQVAVAGHPVTAAYPGVVAGIIHDRFPYGNAVLIETVLEAYPASWWDAAQLSQPAPTLVPRSALTCPPDADPLVPASDSRSFYVLYAHLQQIENLFVGDAVSCGQALGTVGDSGNALNPHLHFETRVGPSGLRLESMAHYDASASTQEMSTYCLWRISGLFQLTDPLRALGLQP